jgi:hypothetical protein
MRQTPYSRLRNHLSCLTTIPLILALLTMAQSIMGATVTWNPGTTDFNLSSNWTGGSPAGANNATFTGVAGATLPSLTADLSTQGLTFSTTATS